MQVFEIPVLFLLETSKISLVFFVRQIFGKPNRENQEWQRSFFFKNIFLLIQQKSAAPLVWFTWIESSRIVKKLFSWGWKSQPKIGHFPFEKQYRFFVPKILTFHQKQLKKNWIHPSLTRCTYFRNIKKVWK